MRAWVRGGFGGLLLGMMDGCVWFHLSATTTLGREDLQNSRFLEKEKKERKRMNIKTSTKVEHCRGKRVGNRVEFCFGISLAELAVVFEGILSSLLLAGKKPCLRRMLLHIRLIIARRTEVWRRIGSWMGSRIFGVRLLAIRIWYWLVGKTSGWWNKRGNRCIVKNYGVMRAGLLG